MNLLPLFMEQCIFSSLEVSVVAALVALRCRPDSVMSNCRLRDLL